MKSIRIVVNRDIPLLDQLENAKATASDGDIILLEAGRDSRAYEFVGTRYSVAINEWVPHEYAKRITGIMASGNAWYDSDVDDLASLTTKGWVYSGGVVDDASGIIITSSSGANRYIRIPATVSGAMLVLAKLTPRTINGASNENMPAPYFNTASKVHRFVIGKNGNTALNGIADNTAFRTQGNLEPTAGQPVYGYADDYRVELSTTVSGASYNLRVGVNEASQSGTFSASTVGVITHAQTGNESSVQKLIFFSLS